MPLPGFDSETGRLPEGEHPAAWEEVVERFGWNSRRRRLLDGLADAMELLEAAGCRRVWLNGSFVTAKEEPGDFDASLGRTRTGSEQDDALPKTMACLSSNVDSDVA